MSKQPVFKVIFLGAEKSGKTTLFRSLVQTNYPFIDEYQATMDLDFATKDNFTLWDYAGAIRYQKEHMLNQLYRASHIGIYCIDRSVPLNEDRIRRDMDALKGSAPTIRCLLVCTKSDLPAQLSREELEELKARHGFWDVVELSAKNDADPVNMLTEMKKLAEVPIDASNNQAVNAVASSQLKENASVKWRVLIGFSAALGMAGLALALVFTGLNVLTIGMITVAVIGVSAVVVSKSGFFSASAERKEFIEQQDSSQYVIQ